MIVAIILLMIIIIVILIYRNSSSSSKPKEPYTIDFRARNINQCARSCKETLNCDGFVLDPSDQCILVGRKISDKDLLTNRDIMCNKIQPISRFQYNSGVSRLDKIKNAIYDCKLGSRQAQLFSNADKLVNISRLANYDLNNTLIDYDLTDIGPLGKLFV